MKYYSEETVKKILKDTKVQTLTKNMYGNLVQDSRIVKPEPEDYPSIEIPDKHGRLIDASELAYEGITDYTLESHMVVSLEDIKDAPTILEATE